MLSCKCSHRKSLQFVYSLNFERISSNCRAVLAVCFGVNASAPLIITSDCSWQPDLRSLNRDLNLVSKLNMQTTWWIAKWIAKWIASDCSFERLISSNRKNVRQMLLSLYVHKKSRCLPRGSFLPSKSNLEFEVSHLLTRFFRSHTVVWSHWKFSINSIRRWKVYNFQWQILQRTSRFVIVSEGGD